MSLPDQRIAWFKRNLDLQIEDLNFEAQRKKIVLYFDTTVIQGGVLGFKDYYEKDDQFRDQFQLDKFGKDRALIQCLIASNWLGPVHMLAPHQAEFIRKLDSGYDTDKKSEWAERAQQFLKDAEIKGAEKLKKDILETREEELGEVLQEHAEFAPQWFKAIQCLLPWHRRLGTWLRNGVLELSTSRTDIPRILGSDFFKPLEDALNVVRAAYSRNNFVDALALTMLIETVEKFNSGDSDEVPRFYMLETNPLFRVINKAKLTERFKCRTVDGKLSIVFRDDHYFVFKVALRRPYTLDDGRDAEQTSQADADLQKLHTAVSNALAEAKGNNNEAIGKITYRGKPLHDLIGELQNLAFFRNDWLQIKAQRELWGMLMEMKHSRSMVEDVRQVYEDELFQKGVNQAIEDIREELSDNVNAHYWASTLWRPLKIEVEKLKERVHANDGGYQGYFRDLGLLRYGFPRIGKPKLHERITDILNDLCSGDEERIKEGCTHVINAYLAGRSKPREKPNELIIASAVLLAARMNRELLQLLDENKKDLPHFSLKIAYTEMLFRLSTQDRARATWRKSEELLKQLDASYYAPTMTNQEQSEMAVGLAYLFYHAWRFHGLDAIWRRPDLADKAKGWQHLINNAIVYARRAHETLSDTYLMKKVYALNQYLFCMVEGGSDELFKEMGKAVRELVRYKNNKEVWQFRFDDTLARYFHRQATLATSEAKWNELMGFALEHINIARKNSDGDQEIEHYYSELTTSKTSGFEVAA